MPDETGETGFLPPGPVPGLADVHVIAAIGRVGDGLVYTARIGDRPARLREYAPLGVVKRGADGRLELVDGWFSEAWRDGLSRFEAQARALFDLSRLLRAGADGSLPLTGPLAEASAYLRHLRAGEAPIPHVLDASGPFILTDPVGDTVAGGAAMAPPYVMRVANQLAAALAIVHAHGLTHLAIAPETVALSGVGAGDGVQLLDFTVDNRAYMPLLEGHEGLVRPGYSAVEQYDALAKDPLPPATDVHAACALVYRLMTGVDPAPWQERFRAGALAGLSAVAADYPPAFVAAIVKGLAIEPEDRHADGGAWLAALEAVGGAQIEDVGPVSLDKPVEAAPPVAVPPPLPPAPPPVPPAAPKKSKLGWLIPALIGLVIAALIAGGIVYAFRSGWFGRTAANNMTAPPVNLVQNRQQPPPPPPPPPSEPELTIGGRGPIGELASSDRRRPSGQYQDVYRLTGRAGQTVEVTVTSADFDPVLTITGPSGFAEFNDDIEPGNDLNARVTVRLPADGTYYVSVSSYAEGATGSYMVEARDPSIETRDLRPALSATTLSGRWRTSGDTDCANPQVVVVTGDRLVSTIDGQTYTHRIVRDDGALVDTLITDTVSRGQSFTYRIAADGNAFTVEDETWRRCTN